MGERYLVTGVQLGLLIAILDEQERKKLVDVIVDKQFIGNTDNINIADNVKLLAGILEK